MVLPFPPLVPGAHASLHFDFGPELLGHIGFLLEIVSFMFTNIFWLRVVYIIGNIFLILYSLLALKWPHGIVILFWSVLLITINMIQLVVRSMRNSAKLTDSETKIWEEIWPQMDKSDFVQLVQAAEWRYAAEGEYVVVEGQYVNELMVLTQGEAVFKRESEGTVYAVLRPVSLLGEVMYMGKVPSYASCYISQHATIIAWNAETLKALQKENPVMISQLFSALGGGAHNQLKIAQHNQASMLKEAEGMGISDQFTSRD